MKPHHLAKGGPPTSKNLSSDLWKSHKSPLWWLGVRTLGPPWPATTLVRSQNYETQL